MSITPEREKQVNFSTPYLDMGQVVVVRANDKTINSPADLAGKVVGTQLGSTSAEAARTIPGIKELKEYPYFPEVFMDLGIGRTQAGVVDLLVANHYAQAQPDQFRVAFQIVPEPIGVAFRKADNSLREAIDKIVVDLINEGFIDQLSEQWLASED